MYTDYKYNHVICSQEVANYFKRSYPLQVCKVFPSHTQ